MGIAYELKQDDLAACPFCGSINQDASSNGMESHFVVCQDCGAEGPAKDTEQEAITAWFTRATLPSNVEVQRDSGSIIAGGSAGTTG